MYHRYNSNTGIEKFNTLIRLHKFFNLESMHISIATLKTQVGINWCLWINKLVLFYYLQWFVWYVKRLNFWQLLKLIFCVKIVNLFWVFQNLFTHLCFYTCFMCNVFQFNLFLFLWTFHVCVVWNFCKLHLLKIKQCHLKLMCKCKWCFIFCQVCWIKCYILKSFSWFVFQFWK